MTIIPLEFFLLYTNLLYKSRIVITKEGKTLRTLRKSLCALRLNHTFAK